MSRPERIICAMLALGGFTVLSYIAMETWPDEFLGISIALLGIFYLYLISVCIVDAIERNNSDHRSK